MSNPSAFVSFDKYAKDLTLERVMNFYARKKFERIDVMLKHQIALIDSFESSVDGLHWLETLRAGLQDILDLERPDVAASSPLPSLDKVKFSSVADGTPLCFEFEGECPDVAASSPLPSLDNVTSVPAPKGYEPFAGESPSVPPFGGDF